MKKLSFDHSSGQITFQDSIKTINDLPKAYIQFQVNEFPGFVKNLRKIGSEQYQHIDNGGVTIKTYGTLDKAKKITHVTLKLEIGYFGYVHVELAETYTAKEYVQMIQDFQNELFTVDEGEEFFESEGFSNHKRLEYLTERANLPLFTGLELNS